MQQKAGLINQISIKQTPRQNRISSTGDLFKISFKPGVQPGFGKFVNTVTFAENLGVGLI